MHSTSVVERQLSGEATLTPADIERNAATFDNVPLWNDQPLLDTFGQIQEIRTYYDFVSVDNDRYVIDGEYRQIMLSAREMNSAALPSGTWINERLTFTHGYGLTLGPVNEVTHVGLPVLFIKDLPLTSTVDLKVTQPAIYFGELSNDHVFVKTRTQEFDYPRGRRQRVRDVPGQRAACRWVRCCDGCCSPSASGPRIRCSHRISPPRAGCSCIGASPSA